MKYILLFSACLLQVVSIAQHACGTDEFHSHKMNTDLEYRAHYYEMEQQVQSMIESGLANRGGDETQYVIPVVVHVIHLGEAVGTGSNISDAQIFGALDGLNERFANMIGNGLDIQLSFCLAKRDPDGCPTTGIVRVNGVGLVNYQAGGITRGGKSECSNAADDEDVKDLSRWPVTQFYNIWVVHTICGGWAGYAYYPWGGLYDGAVMHRQYMTYNGTTLTHEIGHAFNLPHTFDGDNGGENCPPNGSCSTEGDRVCDTPPHKINDCGSTNPCTAEGIWDNSRRNYMSYCGSTNRFTQGQKERMHAALQVFPRANLLNSLACVPSDFETTFIKNNVTCIGNCDGTLSVNPTCEGDYNYTWSNGETGTSINELCPGDYSVVIEEINTALMHTMDFTIEDGNVVDTTAMIEIDGDIAFCEGESVVLSSVINGTYAWSNGAQSDEIEVTESGDYSIIVNDVNGCTWESSPLQIIVFPLPIVNFTLPELVNYMDNPFPLNTGLPAGGAYSGPGTSDGNFYPALAGVGTHVVTYSYTDENGCENQAQQTIVVEPFVSVHNLQSDDTFRIYPNPSNGLFYIEMAAHESTAVACFDAVGQLIFIQHIPAKSNTDKIAIQMPAAADGLYYLRLMYGDKIHTHTLLVTQQ